MTTTKEQEDRAREVRRLLADCFEDVPAGAGLGTPACNAWAARIDAARASLADLIRRDPSAMLAFAASERENPVEAPTIPGARLADLSRRRVVTLATLGLMLSKMAGGEAAEVVGFDAADLHSEVLTALAIEDAEFPDVALEVAREHPEGDILSLPEIASALAAGDRGKPEFVVAEPVGSADESDEDGRPLWYCEIQTVGGWSVIATVWGADPEMARARAEACAVAMSAATLTKGGTDA